MEVKYAVEGDFGLQKFYYVKSGGLDATSRSSLFNTKDTVVNPAAASRIADILRGNGLSVYCARSDTILIRYFVAWKTGEILFVVREPAANHQSMYTLPDDKHNGERFILVFDDAGFGAVSVELYRKCLQWIRDRHGLLIVCSSSDREFQYKDADAVVLDPNLFHKRLGVRIENAEDRKNIGSSELRKLGVCPLRFFGRVEIQNGVLPDVYVLGGNGVLYVFRGTSCHWISIATGLEKKLRPIPSFDCTRFVAAALATSIGSSCSGVEDNIAKTVLPKMLRRYYRDTLCG